MIHPNFLVFVDPFAAYKPEGNEPDAASMLVQRLVGAGHNPFIDAKGQPSISDIRSTCGFVVCEDGSFIDCADFNGEKILCLQYYNEMNLTDDEVKFLISKFAPLYNDFEDHPFPAGDYSHLTIDPIPVNDIIEQSDFLGNTIRMFDDHSFVVDPAPPINLLKREVDEVE